MDADTHFQSRLAFSRLLWSGSVLCHLIERLVEWPTQSAVETTSCVITNGKHARRTVQLGLLLVDQISDWKPQRHLIDLRARRMEVMAIREAKSIQQCVTNDKLNSSRFNPFSNFSLFPSLSRSPGCHFLSLPFPLLLNLPFIISNCLISDICTEWKAILIQISFKLRDKPLMGISIILVLWFSNPRTIVRKHFQHAHTLWWKYWGWRY